MKKIFSLIVLLVAFQLSFGLNPEAKKEIPKVTVETVSNFDMVQNLEVYVSEAISLEPIFLYSLEARKTQLKESEVTENEFKSIQRFYKQFNPKQASCTNELLKNKFVAKVPINLKANFLLYDKEVKNLKKDVGLISEFVFLC